MKRINVLLVEDEVLIREGLRSLLEKEDFIGEVCEVGSAAEYREQIVRKTIDMVLLDIKLPGTKGLELVSDITGRQNHPKVIVVTGLEGVELIINLLKAGVHGIVFKLDGYNEIVRTIKEIIKSGHCFQDKITKIIQTNSHRWDHVPPVVLSYQDNELLRIISSGLTTKEMALQLRMTEATTETYRTRLIRKLGVPNSAALLAYAYRNGIL